MRSAVRYLPTFLLSLCLALFIGGCGDSSFSAGGGGTGTDGNDTSDDGDDDGIEQPGNNELGISILSDSIAENGGIAVARISRGGDTDVALQVTVSFSIADRIRVNPSTVIIQPGRTLIEVAVHGIDDDLVQDDTVVTVTVSAPSYQSASDSIVVISDDVPGISFHPADQSVDESDGSVEVTLRRNTDASDPLTFTLTSSNTSVIQIPAGLLQFPAGESEVTLSLSVIANPAVTASQHVTITASASGFPNATANIQVIDSQVPLRIEFESLAFPESVGTVRGTLSRNLPDLPEATITLTSSNPGRLQVPSTVVMPAGVTGVPFNIEIFDNEIVDGNVRVSITATVIVDSITVTETVILTIIDDDPGLVITVEKPDIDETNQFATAVIRRTGGASQAITVVLSTEDETRLAWVSPTVVMAFGVPEVSLQYRTIDNDIPDGDAEIDLIAASTGLTTGRRAVLVRDNEGGLNLQAPSTVTEGDGTFILSVSRTGSGSTLAAPLTVNLRSTDETEIILPPTVTIPAGERTVNITGTVVDDLEDDGDQTVELYAFGVGIDADSAYVTVIDNDEHLGIIASRAVISENGETVQLTIKRPPPISSAATGTLTINDTTELSTGAADPSTIGLTFLVGQNRTTVILNSVDDSIVDGTQTVRVTFTLPGVGSTFIDIDVADDDDISNPNGFAIQGTVKDEGVAVEGTRVELRYNDISTNTTVQTNTVGKYRFEGLIGDIEKYTVHVRGTRDL